MRKLLWASIMWVFAGGLVNGLAYFVDNYIRRAGLDPTLVASFHNVALVWLAWISAGAVIALAWIGLVCWRVLNIGSDRVRGFPYAQVPPEPDIQETFRYLRGGRTGRN